MADVTLTYKGQNILQLSATGNKTIKTGGKYCEGDIGLAYVKSGSGGIADKVPAQYATYATQAEALLTAQGGTYTNLLILEDNSYIAICFLGSGFTVQGYNLSTTEYTANGFWYAQYTKSTSTWALSNYTSTTSTGDSFLNNGQFTTTKIYYNSQVIFPLPKLASGSVPIEVSTDAGMTAVLTSSNVGNAYKFTGTTGTYTNGDIYIVEETA